VYACLVLYLPVPVTVLLIPTAWLEGISPGLGSITGLVLVLSAGFLVNAATGLAPTLLIMRGWSGTFSAIRLAAAAVTVGALVAGGQTAGAIGMAWGSSVAMIVENIAMFVASTRCLRTQPYP
jgi:hypothetical protein